MHIDEFMLTGDNEKIAKAIAGELGIKKFWANLLPEDKVKKIEEIEENLKHKNSLIAFVGDGTNDAPVLARADVGIAMGEKGTDTAIEVADIVLMSDDLAKIPQALHIAKNTKKILWQNILFALGTKLMVILLGVLGIANLWEAVFADVGVTIIAVFNSLRILKMKM